MFLCVNKVMFDKLGYCKHMRLNVQYVNQTLHANGVDKNLALKNAFHSHLIGNAIESIEKTLKNVDDNMVGNMAIRIIPQLCDETTDDDNTDVPVVYFNCDDNDPEGVSKVVDKIYASGLHPAIIFGISNEEIKEVDEYDTILLMISFVDDIIGENVIGVMEVEIANIPGLKDVHADDSWGMLYPLVVYDLRDNTIFPMDTNSVSFGIYEKKKKA